ncbi:MAG: hypothetical protein HOJ22_08345 [Chloroflexi bacterium]|nr:hypothetical protein [Chloroflexota bacterium]MBT5628287.1 hypothetical protein [Chloroflexota bacterium]
MINSKAILNQSSRFVPSDSILKFGYSPNGGIEFDSVSELLSFSNNGTPKVEIGSDGLAIRDGNGLVVGNSSQVAINGTLEEFQMLGNGSADSTATIARWSDSSAGPRIYFYKGRGSAIGATPAAGTLVQDGDTLGEFVWWGDDGNGANRNIEAARIAAKVDGTPGTADMPTALIFSTTSDGGANATERMRIDRLGGMYIGETVNANMSRGITINQGGFDNEVLDYKSSDIAHGVTAFAETDTFHLERKVVADSGGLESISLTEDTYAVSAIGIVTNEVTTDTSTSLGAFIYSARLKSGTGATDMAAAANMFTWNNNGDTRLLLKGNGDVHIANTTLSALDDEDDIGLVRAFQKEASGGMGIAMTKWDEQVVAEADDLKRVGVLSSEGDFVVQQRLNSLFGGAIWQQNEKHLNLVERVNSLTVALESANKRLAAISAPGRI